MQTCDVSGTIRCERLVSALETLVARGAVTLAVVAALVPPWRRLVGALTEAPTTATAAGCAAAWLLPAGVGLAATASCLRRGVADGDANVGSAAFASPRFRRTSGVLGGAAVLMAAALTMPGTSIGARVVLWLPAVLLLLPAAVAASHPLRRRVARKPRAFGTSSPWRGAPNPPVASWHGNVAAEAADAVRPSVDGRGTEPDDSLIAQLVRRRTADGVDTITGRLAARFETGRRMQSLHASFCPPLAMVPEVDWSLDGEIEAEVKLVQRLPYGVRFDVRLSEPAEDALTLELAFTARAVASQTS